MSGDIRGRSEFPESNMPSYSGWSAWHLRSHTRTLEIHSCVLFLHRGRLLCPSSFSFQFLSVLVSNLGCGHPKYLANCTLRLIWSMAESMCLSSESTQWKMDRWTWLRVPSELRWGVCGSCPFLQWYRSPYWVWIPGQGRCPASPWSGVAAFCVWYGFHQLSRNSSLSLDTRDSPEPTKQMHRLNQWQISAMKQHCRIMECIHLRLNFVNSADTNLHETIVGWQADSYVIYKTPPVTWDKGL